MAYDAIHTGIEALVNNLLLVTSCAQIDIVLSPNHEVVGEVLDLGSLTVQCAKVRPSPSVTGTMRPPATRVDGTPLTLGEIDHYVFEIAGDGCVRAATVDTDGLVSEFSDCGVKP